MSATQNAHVARLPEHGNQQRRENAEARTRPYEIGCPFPSLELLERRRERSFGINLPSKKKESLIRPGLISLSLSLSEANKQR
jgi:hypothetical protein